MLIRTKRTTTGAAINMTQFRDIDASGVSKEVAQRKRGVNFHFVRVSSVCMREDRAPVPQHKAGCGNPPCKQNYDLGQAINAHDREIKIS